MTLRIGITLPQFTDDRERFIDAVRVAEGSGIDSVWLFDHLWPLSGGKKRPILECWTALSFLAARTERVGVGTLVTRSSLRHPAMLAKMAATVACIAPGRVTITIGSGDEVSRGENEGFGLPYWSGPDRLEQLRSTVEVVRSFLSGRVLTQHDGFTDIDSLPTSPLPRATPALWIGGRSGDTLEIAGTLADGWNGWGGDPDRFAQDAQELLRFSENRPIELSWGGVVALDDLVALREQLSSFVAVGATHLIVTPKGGWTRTKLVSFAEEVVPDVRKASGS